MTKANKYYAGIGSRETPEEICQIFEKIGEELAKKGYILRSGGAEGADESFEKGCDKVKGKKEIFIPWKGFNKSTSELIGACDKAKEIAEEIIPWWYTMNKWPQILHGRNIYQVLGKDFSKPVNFVVCWTEGAKLKGGTATAMKLARKNNITIYNFGSIEDIKKFESDLKIKTELYEEF